MAVLLLHLLLLLPTLFSSLISPSHQALDDHLPEIHSQAVPNCSSSSPIVCEIHELKFRVARLESVLEGSTEQLVARSRYVDKCEKRIEEMDREIEELQSVLSNLKHVAAEEERVEELQIEVNHLWQASRKNNFELHILQSKAEEAQNQLEIVASRAEQMANIVTEMWIQIQQLEQALQISKIRRAKLQRETLSRRCTFFKLIRSFEHRYLKVVVGFVDQSTPNKESTWGFYVSEALKWLTQFLSAVKSYHHQLQAIVRREMQRHAVTAPLANAELIFIMASAFILFPIMSAWMLLLSQWS